MTPALTLRAELATLIRLAWPIALAQFGVMLMSLVDTAILGRVSVDDLAGAAMANSVVFSAMAPAIGLTAALEPLVAQSLGAGTPRRAWSALRAVLTAGLWLCIPIALASVCTVFALPRLGVPATVVRKTLECLLARVPSIAFFVAFLAAKTYLQCHGRTNPALVASLVANGVNVVACNALVRGDAALRSVGLPALGLPELGAFGAGLANSIGTLVLAAMLFRDAYALRPAGPEPAPGEDDYVPPRTALALGLPVGFQFLAEIGVFSMVALTAGRLGARVASAHQIAFGLASFTFMGALGVSGATAVRVGHAVGAGTSPRRVGLLGLATGAVFMGVCALTFATVPHGLVGLFTSDPEVRAVGAGLLSIAAVFQLFDGVQCVAAGALRGAGDVRFPFAANVAAHWLVGFPTAVLLGFGLGWGAPGLWWGLTAGLVTVSLALGARFVAIARGPIARV